MRNDLYRAAAVGAGQLTLLPLPDKFAVAELAVAKDLRPRRDHSPGGYNNVLVKVSELVIITGLIGLSRFRIGPGIGIIAVIVGLAAVDPRR